MRTVEKDSSNFALLCAWFLRDLFIFIYFFWTRQWNLSPFFCTLFILLPGPTSFHII